jgi:tetratricopeptide (TPR) repeat protein
MTKACHTIAFVNLLIGELKEEPSWDKAEFLAGLALLSIEAMSQRQLAQAFHRDLQAEVWISVANARRRAAEWKRAHQALANADRLLKEGTGDARRAASLLSISASTLADEGEVSRALEALEKCREIYRDLTEWALLARTLMLYKDAFLDLLYLYGLHSSNGELEKAARVCRRALTDSALSGVAHEQLRTLWTQLLEAAQHRAIGQDLLRDIRQYLSVHWKHPAATPPIVAFH